MNLSSLIKEATNLISKLSKKGEKELDPVDTIFEYILSKARQDRDEFNFSSGGMVGLGFKSVVTRYEVGSDDIMELNNKLNSSSKKAICDWYFKNHSGALSDALFYLEQKV